MAKRNGTFCLVAETYDFCVEYSYYWDNGSWEQPPEEELTIKEVSINGTDITDFYWDWVDSEELYSRVLEYARDNI
jgi:hypothetical protein|tara:strand:- start:715 stop:942 length:228 start_codon:yes stop_codon:yes gene_type:complete